MFCVNSFCEVYSGPVMISFYDTDSRNYVTSILLHDSKKGIKALACSYAFATIESMHVGADKTVCCTAYMNA